MRHHFEAAFTDAMFAAQADQACADATAGLDDAPVYQGEFGEAEIDFIGARDSFYLTTVGFGGWPDVQHRGGPVGLVEVLDARTLVFPDYRGSRRCVSLGNISQNPRVCLFMMDYERGAWLKILGVASLIEASPRPFNGEPSPHTTRAGRYWMVKLEGFDWNGQQYIPRRFAEDRVRGAIGSLQERIRVLKRQVLILERAQ